MALSGPESVTRLSELFGQGAGETGRTMDLSRT